MTKKDLFRIILKLMGIYLLALSLISIIPSIMSLLYGYYEGNFILYPLLILFLIIILFYILTFKPDIIIGLFKLDKGFDDETINFSGFNAHNVLKTSLILIGLWALFKNLPQLISHIIQLFVQSVRKENYEGGLDDLFNAFDNGYRIESFTVTYEILIVVFAFILIAKHKAISYWFLGREEKNDENDN